MHMVLIGIGFILLLGSLFTGCVTTYVWIFTLEPPPPVFQESLAPGMPRTVTTFSLDDGEYTVRVEPHDGSAGGCVLEVRTDRGDLVGRDEDPSGSCLVIGRTTCPTETWVAHATWKGRGRGYVSVYPDKDVFPHPLDKAFGATLLAGFAGLVTMVWGLFLSFGRRRASRP